MSIRGSEKECIAAFAQGKKRMDMGCATVSNLRTLLGQDLKNTIVG
ncbi:MAG: hypothetical protein ACYS9T_02450 [Planctomycetota bacterium]